MLINVKDSNYAADTAYFAIVNEHYKNIKADLDKRSDDCKPVVAHRLYG